MTPPMYSDDQPDKPAKRPDDGVQRYSVSREIFIRMRDVDALLVRKSDMERYVEEARTLKAHYSNWVAALWALLGIAASLFVAAATATGQLVLFGSSAALCLLGAFGCFIADRQVNQGRQAAAEKLARDMENAPVDLVEIRPLRSDEDLPPPALNT
jgi:hypothetical protein